MLEETQLSPSRERLYQLVNYYHMLHVAELPVSAICSQISSLSINVILDEALPLLPQTKRAYIVKVP